MCAVYRHLVILKVFFCETEDKNINEKLDMLLKIFILLLYKQIYTDWVDFFHSDSFFREQ
jgi:hypothetical protein